MNIRQIDFTEMDCVAGLFDQYRMFYDQPSDPDLALKFLRARLCNRESVLFVAFLEVGGNSIPMGFTQLYPSYSSIRAVKNWTLNDLFVEPGYRNRDIGKALIRSAIDFARKDGVQWVELSTGTKNYIAQAIYERIGFRKQPPESDFLAYRLILDIQNQKQ